MADTLYEYAGTDPTGRYYKVTEDLRSYRCDKVGNSWVETELNQPEHLIQQDEAYSVYTLPSESKKK